MEFRRRFAAVLVSALFGSAAWAGDVALVLGNSGYEYLPDIPETQSMNQLGASLRDQGFDVLEDRGLNGEGLRRMASRFETMLAEEPGRVVVVLSGHFVRSGAQVWMLGQGARFPERITAGAQGLSVNAVAGMMKAAQGRALLVLSGPGSDLHVGQGLAPGWHGLKAPQGVTLARSGVRNARNIVEQFMEPGRPMAAVAREMPEGVRLTGFLPATQAFTDEEPDPLQAPDYVAELAYWAAVQDTGTVEAADAYLNRYPRGQFASDARAMKDELQSDSLREVRDGERGLNLSRDQRMEIQRQLTLLGFDPRGIDGVFGRGTRSAIKTWQTRNGMDGTGYMDRAQWRLLRQQAKLEADRREREAQRRQAEMEKQDRAYWRETGRGETEQGLREYLRHYPDGMFADEAREQLRLIQEERRKTAARAERKAWDQAVQKDTLGSYQGFLNRFPKSQFAGAARDRMAELQDMLANREALDRARSEEDMIIDNEVTRVLIERRLASLDLLDERQADGMFNDKTRRALRQFQRLMNLPPSGYVTRMTLINLLASLGEDPQH